jgi:hypothetical protein
MAAKPNRLINETSPYLLQHARNPVDWYPWGEEAFHAARDLDRPIFLSIGYSSCHWCHVMERESFENSETAALLNEHFISIKVDREERPDVDEVYMQAAQLVTGAGGWPLSVFLKPDREPFFAGTYFPPKGAYGRPGFGSLLLRIAELWRSRRADVDASAAGIAAAIRQGLQSYARPGSVDWSVLEKAAADLERGYDPAEGGFTGAPKFPPSMSLRLLLREHRRTGSAPLLDMVTRTLDRMVRGGIFDQIGGGFHRYSTDDRWLVPHFEKMLYDNALMTVALLEACQVTGRTDFAEAARSALGFVLREMTAPEGGFTSALDADSEGEEGRFYVWTPSEVSSVLGDEDGLLFCGFYDITEDGNFEGGRSIPHAVQDLASRAGEMGLAPEDLEARLAAMRAKLLEARSLRVRPALDDKVIVAWNGLMIGAMAMGGRVLGETAFVEAARIAARFVLSLAVEGGALAHSWRAGACGGPAFQDDYACLINGLIDLYEADFDGRWLLEAATLAEAMLERFRDPDAGGFFLAEPSHGTPLARSKSPTDGVTPSGNSSAALGLARLSRFLARADLWDAAVETIGALGGMAAQAPRAFENLLIAAHFTLSEPREIVLAGQQNDAALAEMRGLLSRTFLPDSVIAWHDASLPLPVAQGKTAGDALAAAFVCRNYACQAPVYSAEDLAGLLAPPLR